MGYRQPAGTGTGSFRLSRTTVLPAAGKPLTAASRFVPTWDGVAGRAFLKITKAELTARLDAYRKFAARMTVIAEVTSLRSKAIPPPSICHFISPVRRGLPWWANRSSAVVGSAMSWC